jgi:HAD superfamily hydrolase (TIGR01549 family)
VSGHVLLKYRGLLTDLDNTLYDFAALQECACDAVIRAIGTGSREDLICALLFSLHGVESFEAIRDYLVSLNITDEEAAMSAFTTYNEAKVRSLKPYPGVIDVLHQLHAAGVRIGAVSNAISTHARTRLAGIGTGELIPILITPDICGCKKPDPEMFQRAALEIGIPLSQICVLGDNLVNDIAPAQALGIYSVHARYGDRLPAEFAGDAIPDAVIDTFTELLEIFGITL